MSLAGIQNRLHRIHRDYNSTTQNLYSAQIATRFKAIPLAADEVWTGLKFTGTLAIDIPGLIIKAPIMGLRKMVRSSTLFQMEASLPMKEQVLLTLKKIIKLMIGFFLTATVGLILNPDWNYSLHVKLGLIHPALPYDPSDSPTAQLYLKKGIY